MYKYKKKLMKIVETFDKFFLQIFFVYLDKKLFLKDAFQALFSDAF